MDLINMLLLKLGLDKKLIHSSC